MGGRGTGFAALRGKGDFQEEASGASLEKGVIWVDEKKGKGCERAQAPGMGERVLSFFCNPPPFSSCVVTSLP